MHTLHRPLSSIDPPPNTGLKKSTAEFCTGVASPYAAWTVAMSRRMRISWKILNRRNNTYEYCTLGF